MGEPTPSGVDFVLELSNSPQQPLDSDRADALLTVTARPGEAFRHPGRPRARAEILIMDRSLSMKRDGKLDEAKRAVCAAIDVVPDGTYLAVIAGHRSAEVIHPADGTGLARVDPEARRIAKNRVRNQYAAGGTAIGTWLTRAALLFAQAAPDGAARHAVLYTDGKNQHESAEELDRALAACGDRFSCDARGLGHDWDYAELLRITGALHGEAKAVLDARNLTADLVDRMRHSQRVAVGRTVLGLTLNSRFRLEGVSQLHPVAVDLTPGARKSGTELRISLGPWSPGDRRQYRLTLGYTPDSLVVGEDVRAARVRLYAEDGEGVLRECGESAPLLVRRRAVPAVGTLAPDLTRNEEFEELGRLMRAITDEMAEGNRARADTYARRAVELAARLGDTTRLAALRQVTETGSDGRIRVRRAATRGDFQELGVDSTRTGPVPEPEPDPLRPPAPQPPQPPEPPGGRRPERRLCPRGHVTTGPVVNFCELCGYSFQGRALEPAPPGVGWPPAGAHAGSDPEADHDPGRAHDPGRDPNSDLDAGRDLDSDLDAGRDLDSDLDAGRDLDSDLDAGRDLDAGHAPGHDRATPRAPGHDPRGWDTPGGPRGRDT